MRATKIQSRQSSHFATTKYKGDEGSELRFQAPLDGCIYVCLNVDFAAYAIST